MSTQRNFSSWIDMDDCFTPFIVDDMGNQLESSWTKVARFFNQEFTSVPAALECYE